MLIPTITATSTGRSEQTSTGDWVSQSWPFALLGVSCTRPDLSSLCKWGELLVAETLQSGREESILSQTPGAVRHCWENAFPAMLGWGTHPAIAPHHHHPGTAQIVHAFFQGKRGLNGLRPELCDSLQAIVLFPQRFWCPGFCGLITVCSKWS